MDSGKTNPYRSSNCVGFLGKAGGKGTLMHWPRPTGKSLHNSPQQQTVKCESWMSLPAAF